MSKKENSAPMEPLEEQEIQEQPAEAAEVCGEAPAETFTLTKEEMEKLEAEVKTLEEQLEANACDYGKYSELYAQKEALDAQLLTLMERWEQLAGEAES